MGLIMIGFINKWLKLDGRGDEMKIIKPKKFLGMEFNSDTMMYGPYPEEMRIEVSDACDVPVCSGISALAKLWAWKKRLGLKG